MIEGICLRVSKRVNFPFDFRVEVGYIWRDFFSGGFVIQLHVAIMASITV